MPRALSYSDRRKPYRMWVGVAKDGTYVGTVSEATKADAAIAFRRKYTTRVAKITRG